jgi:hypothetical protein
MGYCKCFPEGARCVPFRNTACRESVDDLVQCMAARNCNFDNDIEAWAFATPTSCVALHCSSQYYSLFPPQFPNVLISFHSAVKFAAKCHSHRNRPFAIPTLFPRYQAAACCLGQTTRGLEGSGNSTSNCVVCRLHLRCSLAFIFLAPLLPIATSDFILPLIWHRRLLLVWFGHPYHTMIVHLVLDRFCSAVASWRLMWQQVKHEFRPHVAAPPPQAH